MEIQTVLNGVLGIAAFLGGWVLNNITKTMERLDNDVREMPLNYVTKDDYHRDIREIKDMIKQIYVMLAEKADK